MAQVLCAVCNAKVLISRVNVFWWWAVAVWAVRLPLRLQPLASLQFLCLMSMLHPPKLWQIA